MTTLTVQFCGECLMYSSLGPGQNHWSPYCRLAKKYIGCQKELTANRVPVWCPLPVVIQKVDV